ncbi:LIM zinc-binding domain-containing [Takifugu flavidus]|uniref:LIM zinc-binding domain-containing n=1 Tax=Takifugu flavidus TaxID=433684 RepID=A0A5C6N840_9TELE|nr:LIM zinc-binding domain-containing [Takifugu flavidus]
MNPQCARCGKIVYPTEKVSCLDTYTQHTRTKERQIRKFTTLLAKHNPSGTNPFSNHDTSLSDSQREKWVKKLSDRELTQTEEEVLSKGLNFSVTPEEVPTVELITATETAIRNNKLPEAEAEQIRLKVTAALASAKPPTSNITNEEKRAIASLAKDKNITILPADKGRCTVVLNTTDYDTKILSLLTDTATYEKLKRDPTSSYKKKVVDLLQKLEKDKAIDRPQYYRLYPGETIPCIYGLPKIHKPGTPLRPIVSSINSVTYNISKYLASILSPMVGNTPHHIKNSQDFAQKVSGLTLLPEETMVSYDVTSLFTCIPTASAIDTIHKHLLLDKNLTERTTLTPAQICTMLDLCLNTTYFQYREGFYRQKHGCAMGSPVSPIVANLYMEKVESQALTSFTGTAPSHWFRYVDDTWVKIQTQELEAFSDHLNKTDEHVKF